MKIFKVILSMLGVMAILGGTLVATSAIKKRAIFNMSNGLETRVSVKTHQEFCLKIKSNPSTGYSWALDQPLDETMLQLIEHDIEEPDGTAMAGASQFEIWAFRALKVGETAICLKYVRPWEKNAPPPKTHSFIVSIE
jgi:inhibitor of cysteine peptidase